MADILRIELNFVDTQEADDGNTTHYGGVYWIDGEMFQCYGNDRSDSWHSDAEEKIVAKVQAKWPDFLAWQKAQEDEDQRQAQAWVDAGMPSPPPAEPYNIKNDAVIELFCINKKRATLVVTRTKAGKFSFKLVGKRST